MNADCGLNEYMSLSSQLSKLRVKISEDEVKKSATFIVYETREQRMLIASSPPETTNDIVKCRWPGCTKQGTFKLEQPVLTSEYGLALKSTKLHNLDVIEI
jgi:hypothetical protein